MLHARTSIHHRESVAAVLPPAPGLGSHLRDVDDAAGRLARERAIDAVLAESFPASDPPSWNPGVARLESPGPWHDLRRQPGAPAAVTGTGNAGVIDVSDRTEERTLRDGLVSLTAAVGIVLTVPVVIALIGLPVALGLRLIDLIGWAFAAAIR